MGRSGRSTRQPVVAALGGWLPEAEAASGGGELPALPRLIVGWRDDLRRRWSEVEALALYPAFKS